jgi:hypothetical protein
MRQPANLYATTGQPTHMSIPSALRVTSVQMFESNLEAQMATNNFWNPVNKNKQSHRLATFRQMFCLDRTVAVGNVAHHITARITSILS